MGSKCCDSPKSFRIHFEADWSRRNMTRYPETAWEKQCLTSLKLANKKF